VLLLDGDELTCASLRSVKGIAQQVENATFKVEIAINVTK